MKRSILIYATALLSTLLFYTDTHAQNCSSCSQVPPSYGAPSLTFTSGTSNCTVTAAGSTLSSILSTPSCISGGTLTSIIVGTGQILIIDTEIGTEERVAISPSGAIIHAGDAQAAWVVQTNSDFAGNINISGDGILRICNGVLFHHFGTISYTQSSSFDFCGCAEYIQNGTFTCEAGDSGGLHVECGSTAANTTVAVNQHAPGHASVGTTGFSFLETFGTQNVLACVQDVIINSTCSINPLSPTAIGCVGSNQIQFNLSPTSSGASGTYSITVVDDLNSAIAITPTKGNFGSSTLFTLPVSSADGLRNYIINISDSGSLSCNASASIAPVTPCAVFLPISLGKFIVSEKNCNTSLQWETISEQNISHYAIFRSKQGKRKFEKISMVLAAGNSMVKQTYNFTDIVLDGNYLYKLGIVDMNAAQTFSPTKKVNIKCKNNDLLNIYPNPTSENLYVEIFSEVNDFATVRMYDLTGKLIYITRKDIEVGVSKLKISMRDLAVGSYMLEINGDEFGKKEYKIMKQ